MISDTKVKIFTILRLNCGVLYVYYLNIMHYRSYQAYRSNAGFIVVSAHQ